MRRIQACLSLIATAAGLCWLAIKYIVSAIVWLIGLAGVPGDYNTWLAEWLSMYDVNTWGPYLLLSLGVISLLITVYGNRLKHVVAGPATDAALDAEKAGSCQPLCIVYRPCPPFWMQSVTAYISSRMLRVRQDCFIGVRNTSDQIINNVKVQVTASNCSIKEVPFDLPRRDGNNIPFNLYPNEMQIVRFLSRDNRHDGSAPCVTLYAQDHEISVPSARFSVKVEAFGTNANARVKFDVSIDDGGDLAVMPGAVGKYDDDFDSDIFLSLKVTPVR